MNSNILYKITKYCFVDDYKTRGSSPHIEKTKTTNKVYYINQLFEYVSERAWADYMHEYVPKPLLYLFNDEGVDIGINFENDDFDLFRAYTKAVYYQEYKDKSNKKYYNKKKLLKKRFESIPKYVKIEDFEYLSSLERDLIDVLYDDGFREGEFIPYNYDIKISEEDIGKKKLSFDDMKYIINKIEDISEEKKKSILENIENHFKYNDDSDSDSDSD
tara:strand:- start:592 stop:1242 length:651 start_codon:yes stop_codon:yes gene_type:complete